MFSVGSVCAVAGKYTDHLPPAYQFGKATLACHLSCIVFIIIISLPHSFCRNYCIYCKKQNKKKTSFAIHQMQRWSFVFLSWLTYLFLSLQIQVLPHLYLLHSKTGLAKAEPVQLKPANSKTEPNIRERSSLKIVLLSLRKQTQSFMFGSLWK